MIIFEYGALALLTLLITKLLGLVFTFKLYLFVASVYTIFRMLISCAVRTGIKMEDKK